MSSQITKIKILYISHSSDLGGAERSLLTLIANARDLVIPVVVLPHDGPMVPILIGLGAKVHFSPLEWWVNTEFGIGFNAADLDTRLLRLSEIIVIEKPAVIHTITSVICEGALAAKRHNIPHIWHLHEILRGNPTIFPLLPTSLFYSAIEMLSNRVVVVSDMAKAALDGLVAEKTLVRIYNGVETAPSDDPSVAIRKELGIPDPSTVVLTGATLSRNKDIHTLLHVAEQVAKIRKDVKFILAGGGPPTLVEEVKTQITKLGLEDTFYYLGHRNDFRQILAQSDILVVTSVKESFSLTAAEAMAAAKPVIATDCGGPSELIVDGETGYIVAVGDFEALSKRILDLASDKKTMKTLGRAGLERFSKFFKAEIFAKNFIMLYELVAREGALNKVKSTAIAFEAILAAHQEIALRERKITEQEWLLTDCGNQLQTKDLQIAEQKQQAAQQTSELDSLIRQSNILKQALRERDMEVMRLRTSLSWRITAPLRLLGHQVLKVIDCLKTCAKIMQQTGGARASIAKFCAILRYEGVNGIKKSIRQNITGTPTPQSQHPTSQFQNPETNIFFHPTRGYWIASDPSEYVYIPPHRPAKLDQILSGLQRAPLFSILVPVYNTPPELLLKLINSVTSQWYSNWELIFANDASTSVATTKALEGLDDPRILVIVLPTNQGIAGATNAAFAAATGDFIVLLDHDDELTEDCLYELALCIERDNPDYIYSDEDKITPEGVFAEPHFKPDWSPDTMMSTMYVCHVSCIRRDLFLEVGGLQSQYDGCQDWDFVLRLTEKTKKISHIPKVLYHWRIISGSVAGDIGAKPYVVDASRRVREDALKRRGIKGSVEAVEQVSGYFRVNYHLVGDPLISIIIPTRDNGKILRRCVNSIFDTSRYRNFELILLDNGSVASDSILSLQQLAQKDQVKVIRHDAPFNFSELNNIGVCHARGEILLFLNDDTEVKTADWLERMGGYAQLPHVGAVGAKLLYPGGRQVQHAGVINLESGPAHAFLNKDSNSPGYYMRNLLEYNWLAVTGACLMIERAKLESVGGFDETFPVAYNDIDLCLRLHDAEFYNVVCQAVQLIHHESASRGQDHLDFAKITRLNREKQHLFDRHPHYFQFDPFYNANLHPNGINFEFTGL